MNSIVDSIYETWGVEDAADNRRPLSDSPIQREVGRLLYELVRHGGRSNTLEIGLACGLSALHVCQALHDNGGPDTAIDPNQGASYDSIGILNLKWAGLSEYFRFIGDQSFLALPQLYQDRERFDFVFIDGDHRFDSAPAEPVFLRASLSSSSWRGPFSATRTSSCSTRRPAHSTWPPRRTCRRLCSIGAVVGSAWSSRIADVPGRREPPSA